MRILRLIVGIAAIMTSVAVRADDRKFPYEAFVEAENGENVMSGPGPKYYPTLRLKNGDRVTVHRHDPGGWCMIAPPQGSFSWVRASHVERSGQNRGSIKSNRVVVHTGSQLNPGEFSTIQADLSKGDAVEILDEGNFNFEDGPRLMLKISPVKGEWRWISRKSIVAADAYRSSPGQDEPSSSKRRNGPVAESDFDSFAKPVSTGSKNLDDRRGSSSDDEGSGKFDQGQDQPTGKQRLTAIDQQFREMIQQDPPTWNLEQLESQYQQLDDDVGSQSMSKTISLRMDAVKRYRKIHRDYVDFFKLTSETKQRDAELMLQQAQYQSQLQTSDRPQIAANPDLQSMSQSPPTVVPPQASPAPAFDGAGIVQKMARTFPGGPQYVLITPEGRMLSYLQPTPGVDLSKYVGRPMGITGQRIHRDDWNADMITVRGLQPVQLRGSR